MVIVKEDKKVDLIDLSIKYTLHLANQKKYNVQMIAISKFLESEGLSKIKEILSISIYDLSLQNKPFIAPDFIYKNDSFTPRNMYLINPLYYIYYNLLVFIIVEKMKNDKNEVNFSTENIQVFYSGILEYTDKSNLIKENTTFNKSYNRFRYAREKELDKYILKIDLKDFFNSISTEKLIDILKRKFGESNEIDQLKSFFEICNFNTLPQLHYSIASSILSQVFLSDFDERFELILHKHNIKVIRFVDDMFLVKQEGIFTDKDMNNILDELSSLLWKEGLLLNISKTELMSPEKNKLNYSLFKNHYDEPYKYSTEKVVEDRANEIIENGDFVVFFKSICQSLIDKGIDVNEHKILLDKYISINGEDANKVLNAIIYGGKWKNLNKKELVFLSKNWIYILYNPSQYTILFIFINKYLYNKNLKKVKRVITYLYKNIDLRYRESLITITFILQKQIKPHELIAKIKNINPTYVMYINKFL